MLSTGNFPYNVKLAGITPVFKKKSLFLEKRNYRPVSVLFALSKTLEKLMQKQIVGYMEKFLTHTYVAIEKVFIHSKRY